MLKLDFLKIEFQNMSIFLISLGNGAKCWIFCMKGAKANFLRFLKVIIYAWFNMVMYIKTLGFIHDNGVKDQLKVEKSKLELTCFDTNC